jgi:hypothetical protein
MIFQNFGFNQNYPVAGSSYVTDGLRIYVDATNSASYPGSGSTWTDLSGYGNNMRVSASFASSPIPTLQFRNTQIQNRASASYTLTSDFTTEVWVNWSGSVSGLFSRMTSYGPGDNFEQAIQPTGKFNYFPDSGWNTNAGNPTFTSGQWTQFASTKTGSTFKMYMNSTLIRTGTISTSAGTLFCVGNRYKSEPAIPTEGIIGDISIVRMYNKALSDAEITTNWNADRSKFGL